MCNLKMCKMKTIVITLFSLLIMISFSSFAEEDGLKDPNPKGKTEIVEKEIISNGNLIVINLNESAETIGLPKDLLEQFEDVMSYPEDVENAAEKECVLIGFTYDDDGYVHVASIRSSNDSFNDHVVTNIEKIRLRDGSVTIGKHYFAKFSFKKL